MAEDSGKVGGAGATGGGGNVGGTSQAGGATEAKGVSAQDRSEVDMATSGVTASEITAQANKVTGAATTTDGFEKAAATTDPAKAKAAEDAKVAASADALAKASPTADKLLSEFRAAGGTLVSSPKGSYITGKEGPNPTIHVGPGTTQEQMRSIAHELGHFDFRGNPQGAYQPPGPGRGLTDHQIEMSREHDYIVNNANAKLADEGHATLVGKTIRDEVLKNTGTDIGVSGFATNNPLLSKGGPLNQRRNEIGDYFGSQLKTSTNDENYRAYYNQSYIDFYRQNFLP